MSTGKTNFAQVGPNVWKSVVELPRLKQPNLPHGIYKLSVDPDTGEPVYVNVEDTFSIPKKIYGNIVGRVSKVANTFRGRPGNTGVLLSGDKGGGKTMTGKAIALYLHHNDKLPIILVMGPMHPVILGKALADVPSAIIFVDEFEKSFPNGRTEDDDRDDSSGAQVSLLSLMDGVLSNKHLFILTTNELGSINEYLKGRPNRVFYNFRYSGLDHSIIEEYCEEKIEDVKRRVDVTTALKFLHNISFDIMQGVVEECVRYSAEPILDLLRDMNINLNSDVNRVFISWKFPKKHALYNKLHSLSDVREYVTIHDSGDKHVEFGGGIYVKSVKQATALIDLINTTNSEARLVTSIRAIMTSKEYDAVRISRKEKVSISSTIDTLTFNWTTASDCEVSNEVFGDRVDNNSVAVYCNTDTFTKLDPKELVGKLFRLNFEIPRSNFITMELNTSELKITDDCIAVFTRDKK